MKVSVLQKYLDDLSRFMTEAGGKAAATDLIQIQKGLSLFADYSLRDFGDFLVRAEAQSRGTSPAPARGGKKAKVDLAALQQAACDLYNAASAATVESIDAFMNGLSSLTKDNLVGVAEALGLTGMKKAKTKAIIWAAIKTRIMDRLSAACRVSIIDCSEDQR